MTHEHARRLAAVAALSMLAAPGAQAIQRTFVSVGGQDSNPCTIAAPCRAFAKAITVTDPAGEIVVLDSGGYGGVTVNKSVSILSPAGVYAGISVFAASDGISVVAPAARVVLRGLAINGQGGNNGIRVQSGEVHIEASTISNMVQAGILVQAGASVRVSNTVVRSNADGLRIAPAAGSVSVLVRDSEFSHHTNAGVVVAPSGGTTAALVTIERSSATKNAAGLTAVPASGANATLVVVQSVTSENTGAGVSASGAGATVFVRESAVTRNGTGLLQASSGILNACGANLLVANTTAQSGAINTASCLDVASGTGTVTGITAGTGLTGGTITGSGTIAIAAGGVGNNQLANGAVDVAKLNTTSTDARYYKQGGNAYGATAIIGTTDNQALDLRVNGSRAMRYEPNIVSPNVIGGSAANNVTAGVHAATVAGGGDASTPAAANRVTDAYGTVSGGTGNRAGDDAGNAVDHGYATVGGGDSNTASGSWSAVGGGRTNLASAAYGAIAGGDQNTASGIFSSVPGGIANVASANSSTVLGGSANVASGNASTVAGGSLNVASGAASFAAGSRAKTQSAGASPAVHDGAFVWADSNAFDFNTSAVNEFAARATGGVRFVTSIDGSGNPVQAVRINPNGELDFGAITRQMLNLFGAVYAVGVQPFTTYFRTGNEFSWFRGGQHVDATNDPGPGGVEMMRLASNGTLLVTGGAVGTLSDRNAKQDVAAIDTRDVLDKVVGLPLTSWSYKADPATRHIGPMAQDFRAAFNVGNDERTITTVDADGVALAAIQGLNAKVDEQAIVIARRDARIAALEARLAELDARHGAELADLRRVLSRRMSWQPEDRARDRPAYQAVR